MMMMMMMMMMIRAITVNFCFEYVLAVYMFDGITYPFKNFELFNSGKMTSGASHKIDRVRSNNPPYSFISRCGLFTDAGIFD